MDTSFTTIVSDLGLSEGFRSIRKILERARTQPVLRFR